MTDGVAPDTPAVGWPAPPDSRSTRPAGRWTTVLDGRRLQQLRRQHALSQERLADRADISLTTVARLERQPRSPCRTRTLARLAAVLGEHPASLSIAASPTR